MPAPFCIGCQKFPENIAEYRRGNRWEEDEYASSSDYVKENEGTYNPTNGHFLCTPCYVKAGMPSSDGGWVAP